jgi:hypothetical protein
MVYLKGQDNWREIEFSESGAGAGAATDTVSTRILGVASTITLPGSTNLKQARHQAVVDVAHMNFFPF